VNISDIELITLYREWCQIRYSAEELLDRPFMPPTPTA